jgi:rhodanese-related sulfurtransferase/CBS domain-containing protein
VVEQISYPRLRELLDGGAQLVEVLPAPEYAEERLPGAINIPLKTLDTVSTAQLDKTKAVVVYCSDALWDTSPRAACRLDTLGFEHVYDYTPGKADWRARGLPREGEKAAEPRAVDFAHQDVATCLLHDPVDEARERVRASPYGFGFVVADGGVLLGRLRKAALDGDPAATAESVMEPGPSTIRADTPPWRLRERLQRSQLTTAVISDPDGRLLGVVRRADLPPDDASTR